MKKFIDNRDNLKEEDITEVVKRVKALLINSNDEIMLAHSHTNYHFPGGHVEDGETLIQALNREVEEEVGIELNIEELDAFACSIGYWKDWPEEGKNRKTEVYYYEIRTDLKPNLENVYRTEHEKDGNFEILTFKLDEVEDVLRNNAKEFGDPKGIAREMLQLFEIYNEDKVKNR